MGLCKSVYTARSLGQKFPEHILRALAPVAAPEPRKPELIVETEQAPKTVVAKQAAFDW